jgi:SAM-dependent methyltransferase
MSVQQWDERYGAEGWAYGNDPNDWVRANADKLKARGLDLLSLGEGEGRNAAFLASLGFRVTGVDQSAVGLDKARLMAREKGVDFETEQADLAHYDLGKGRWDAIISIWCHLPSALRAPLHARVVRGLKPGGLFLLEAYTPNQLKLGTGGPKDPDMLASLETLKKELEGLEWVSAAELKRHVKEGPFHSGQSAVVQILAKKPNTR